MPVPNSVPRFVSGAVIGAAVVSVANTARDGTGTVATVVTAGTQGTLVELIRAQANGTTTAGMLRLFIYDGANYRFYAEIPVAAITPSGTVEAWEGELIPTKPLVLPTGYSLRATTHNGESFTVFATGGDY